MYHIKELYQIINDAKRWKECKSLLVNFGWDVFHEHWYNSALSEKGALPEAFFYSCGGNFFFMPYIAKKLPLNKKYSFFETPDGFGSPLSTTQDKNFLYHAFHYLNESLFKKKIVAGIIRPHPFLDKLPDFFETIEISRREYVYLNIGQDYEKIFTEYSKSLRRKLSQAKSRDIRVEISKGRHASDSFAKMYRQIMKEVKARPGVKYSDEYFDQIINGQDASSQLYLCFDSSDNLLAGAVVLFGPNNACYHLSASKKSSWDFSPNDVVRDFVIQDLSFRAYDFLGFGGGRTDERTDTAILQKEVQQSILRCYSSWINYRLRSV